MASDDLVHRRCRLDPVSPGGLDRSVFGGRAQREDRFLVQAAEIEKKIQHPIPLAFRAEFRNRFGIPAGLGRYVVEKGAVTLEKVQPEDDDPFVAFEEWASPEDEQLYRDL